MNWIKIVGLDSAMKNTGWCILHYPVKDMTIEEAHKETRIERMGAINLDYGLHRHHEMLLENLFLMTV